MITPKNVEDLANYVENGENVFCFMADWCGDCRFIKPYLPEIEADFPELQFIEVDRDQYIDIAKIWNILGIPSFVAIKNGEECGRFVSKNRKTKEEIEDFLRSVR